MTDEEFMRKAISIAAENPRHPFGAVIVECDTNRVVSEGVNQSKQHPMWHGEIVAINHAVASMSDIDWSKAKFDVPLQYFTEEMFAASRNFPPDIAELDVKPNRLIEPVLLRYYERDWKRHNP